MINIYLKFEVKRVKNDYGKRIMETMLELVSVPSISGTESENLAACKIYDMLKAIPYFTENADKINLIKVKNDVLKRKFVSALFLNKKKTNKTVILTGHFDVVGIEEFGHLKDIAFDPLKYSERIKELNLDDDTASDIQSGDWIFGRGTSDMKYGIALDIELMRKLSQDDGFDGNILFLAVPGEESNSEGMLAAVPHLLNLKNRYSLEYSGLLLSECCLPKYKGDNSKKIYLGTCGKIMPLFFFAGKETHVCEAFSGLNPNLMASELNRLLELNVNFCDVSGKNIGMPPSCLKQMDLKELYSVQTPVYAASYYNLITLNSDSNELVEKLKSLCMKAFKNAIRIRRENIDRFLDLSDGDTLTGDIEPLVMTFEELYNETKKQSGNELDEYLQDKIEEWKNQKSDNQTISIKIIKEVYEKYTDNKPMIIIGFAPPYYPHKSTYSNNTANKFFIEAVNKTLNYAKEKFNQELIKEDYFMGICDLSYTGDVNAKELDAVSNNMPALNKCYSFPVKELTELNIPGAVFGGFGKDFHKYTERLNLPYSMDIVPELYEYLIKALL